MSAEEVFERKAIPPGKPFIKAGEEHSRAYIIQNGSVRAFIMEGDLKVEVAQYGPGRIIAETCLMSDEPVTLNYEALETTTVIAMTRAIFQKKIAKMDKNVATILEHVMNKLNFQYSQDIEKARKETLVDEDAMALVRSLTSTVPEEKKRKYENAILPHISRMMQELKRLKQEDKAR